MAIDHTRRSLLTIVLGGAAGLLGLTHAASAQTPRGRAGRAQAKPTLTVYKDAACGCCHVWVEYMKAKGYPAFVTDTDIGAIKKKYAIGPNLQSCHTTLVDGFIIEGHVPESDIVRLLRDRPAGVVGLTIPGMPASAPGMDGRPFRPFTVLAFNKAGETTVYMQHTKPE